MKAILCVVPFALCGAFNASLAVYMLIDPSMKAHEGYQDVALNLGVAVFQVFLGAWVYRSARSNPKHAR